jgi:hypothetical protein
MLVSRGGIGASCLPGILRHAIPGAKAPLDFLIFP